MNGLNWEAVKKWLRIIGIIIASITGTTAVNTRGCGMIPQLPPATSPTSPPSTSPSPAPAPRPWDAIGKIQIGSYGCSATLIAGRHSDGTYDAVTAAHCLPVGVRNGMIRLDNGKQVGIVVMAVDVQADCAWLRTIGDVGELPTCELADGLPAPGEPVWHGGYGEHIPRNKESGTVVDPTNAKGQTQYWISVSSGDSGGGIICDKSGKLLSTVCCTTRRNTKADVWGCSVERIRQLRPKDNVNTFEWEPLPIPMVMPE